MENKKIKILTIDDNEDNILSLNVLIKEAFPLALIFSALNGIKGLEIAAAEDPDLILLDIVMSDMDGYEVCRKLKSDKQLKDIPVVFITALRGDKESRILALECGAEGFLNKPMDESELIAQISAMVKIKANNLEKRDEKDKLTDMVSRRTIELEKELAQRKQVEEALRQSELKYYTLFQHAPMGYQSLNEKGFIIDINDIWLSIMGYERNEVIGKWFGDFLHPSHKELFRKVFPENIQRRDIIKSVIFQLLKKNGEMVVAEYTARIGRDEEGQFIRTHCIFQDITERKRAEEELVKAKTRAEDSDRLKSTFLANMSHEIRTPMNAIVGFAGMIADEDISNEDRDHFARIIQSRSEDLMHLINDILEISRIESGNATVMKSEMNLNNILHEIETEMKQKMERIGKSHLSLFCEIPLREKDLIFTSDPYILKQVFSNLIDNAIKYSQTGSIRFGYQTPAESSITFFVSDTGIGISPENQSIIFEHFRQAESLDPHQYGGTGLGLSICKGSLALIGGEIRVESEEGKGSTFFFSLPFELQIPEDWKATTAHEKTPGANEHPAPVTYDWSGKKILMVEDEKSNMEFLQIILGRTRAELIAAFNGYELKEMYDKLDFIDLVLLDIRLPDASGWDLAKEIKAIRPNLPVIAQTAYAMSGDKKKSEESGCDGYISKPISRDSLLKMISKLI